MRLFVAVNPPSQLCCDLDTRLDTVRARLPLAWTAPQAWHLTLMFLGEWPADRLDPLRSALQEAVAGQASFEVAPGGVGAFPSLRRPRVLFLHLDGGDPLRRLTGAVRTAVDAVWPDGPQDHKPLRPHLTLARVKQPLGGPELAQASRLDLGTFEPFTVTEARLMSSALRPDGARHTCEAVLPLAP
jgi:RNA 2',3'-cyclic 3'-phosphodiesterase